MTEKYKYPAQNGNARRKSTNISIETVLRIIGLAVIMIQFALLFVMFYLIPQLF